MSQAPILWRIGTEAAGYGAADLEGKGAGLTGGRWNRAGAPLIYASSTRALACLETLVHLEPFDPLPLNRYLVRIEVPRSDWTARRRFAPLSAHVGWDAEPPGQVSQGWGSRWVQEMKTLLAEVPSIVIEEEKNILINPRHPNCTKVKAVLVRKWLYDPRLSR